MQTKSIALLTLLGPVGLVAQTLTYGASYTTGSVRPGGSVVYDISGSANDVVTVEWGETTARNGLLCVRAFDSSSEVFERTCLNTSPNNPLSRSFRIYRSQMHKLEISERSADTDMPYRVRVSCAGQCTSPPSKSPFVDDPSGPIGYGSPKDSILLQGTHTFLVPLAAEDTVKAEVALRTPSRGRPCVEVTGPTGQPVGKACNSATARVEQKVGAPGIYKVMVTNDNSGPMAYRVTTSCTGTCKVVEPPPPPPTDLTYGVPYEGILQRGAGSVRLSFPANTVGDSITVNLTERDSSSAQPCFTVRGPSGTQIASRCSSISVTEVVRVTTPGKHTVEVYELGNDQVLFFRVMVSCTGTCSVVDPGSPTPEPGRITAQPSQIELVLPPGRTGLTPVTIQLQGERLSGSFTITSKEAWIKPATTSGALPAQVSVNIDAAAIPPTNGSGTIEVVSSSSPAVKLTIPVSVRVEDEKPALFPSGIVLQDDKPQQMLLRSKAGGAAPSIEVLGKKLSQAVRVTAAPGEPADGQDRVLSIAATGSLGRQAGALKISSGGTALTVPITMRSAKAAGVRPLINELSFGGPPAQQLAWRLLHVSNPTEQENRCTITPTLQWIFVYPREFKIGAGKVEEIQVQVNTSGQRAEKQEGRLEVKCWPSELTDNKAETREAVVKLDVSTRLQNLDLDLSGVLLSGRAGEVPACRGLGASLSQPCTLTFSNRTLDDVDFAFGKSPFVTFTPERGKVPAQKNDSAGALKVLIQPVALPQSLRPGFGQDLANVTLNGVQSKLDVYMLVTGAGAGTAAACEARGLQILPMQGGREFVAVAGSASPLDVEVLDDCGNPMREGSVIAMDRRSGKGVALQPLFGTGRWQANWVPPAGADTARTSLEYRAMDSTGKLVGTARQDALFESDRDTPILDLAGVRMGPSLSPGVMTPGALVTIEGRNLASSSSSVQRGTWGTSLNGVVVRVAGKLAAIGSVGREKVVIQVPWDVPTGVSADLIVVREGRHSTPLEVSIVEADPEILSIRDQSNQELQDRGRGVRAGESVWIHATGLGTASASVDTGAMAPDAGVAPRCPVMVDLGDRRITPASSELSTTEVGVYRIRIDLPQDAAGVLPLVLRCGADSFAESKIEVRQ